MDVSQRNTSVVLQATESPINSSAIPSQSPPPYQSPNENGLLREDPVNDCPPMYTDVVKLPTYNESESASNEDARENPSVSKSFTIIIHLLNPFYLKIFETLISV